MTTNLVQAKQQQQKSGRKIDAQTKKRLKELRKRLKEIQEHGKKTHLSYVTSKIRFKPYRDRYLRAKKDTSVKLFKGFLAEYEARKRPVVRFARSLKKLEEQAQRIIIRIRRLRSAAAGR